jgi:hypothetical protein
VILRQYNCGILSSQGTLNMEAICSQKGRFELELHGTKLQKASIIGTAVKAFQRTVFFNHK